MSLTRACTEEAMLPKTYHTSGKKGMKVLSCTLKQIENL
jgi:hypothetical protein